MRRRRRSTKPFKTKPVALVYLKWRKCTRRTQYGTRKWDGMYYHRSSSIGLNMPHKGEEEILQVLIHEIAHWAAYLFLTDEEFKRLHYSHIPHNERVIEKHAFYTSGTF